jgi:hypothetical protein
MRDHERIEELIAIRSLGGLDGPDEATLVAEMAPHGPTCDECRRLETEYGEVAGRLAFALDPEPVPAGMEDRVVGLATGSVARLEPSGGAERRRARRPAGIALRPLVAVAAAALLFVGGLAVGAALTGGGGTEPNGVRVVAFEGEPGSGSLSVAYTPGESGATIVGAGLPALPEGRVYEVWTISGQTPTPGPCLSPAADGSLYAVIDAELGTTDAMAVTVEPESCSTAPTTDPVFVAELTTA